MPTVRRLLQYRSRLLSQTASPCIYCWRCLWTVNFCSLHLLLGKMEDCTDDTLRDPDTPRCSRKSSLAMALFLLYALVTTIMLINLLIAIFRFCSTLSSLRSCSLTFSSPSSGCTVTHAKKLVLTLRSNRSPSLSMLLITAEPHSSPYFVKMWLAYGTEMQYSTHE